MKTRKRILIILGIAQLVLSVFLGFTHPRALSLSDSFEKRIKEQYVTQVEANPHITEAIEKEVLLDRFNRDANVLVETIRGQAYFKDKFFLALFASGLITLVLAFTIPTKQT